MKCPLTRHLWTVPLAGLWLYHLASSTSAFGQDRWAPYPT